VSKLNVIDLKNECSGQGFCEGVQGWHTALKKDHHAQHGDAVMH